MPGYAAGGDGSITPLSGEIHVTQVNVSMQGGLGRSTGRSIGSNYRIGDETMSFDLRPRPYFYSNQSCILRYPIVSLLLFPRFYMLADGNRISNAVLCLPHKKGWKATCAMRSARAIGR
jgi:hypothetical protein